MMGETDEDGNFLLRGQIVGQQYPHVEWVKRVNREYIEDTSKRMIYDQQTGWSPRPNATSHGGMYRYNSRGIRSAPTEYAEQPASDVFRIALFGDSFTHGDDVSWENTWAAQLERSLHLKGKTIEVLNFGVSAYGMDQAFLRWKSLGKNYRPHLVIFGFQPENIARNVNLLRGFYVGQTGIPFSKPRFLVLDDGHLEPINLPCLRPENVPDAMANMSRWKFAKHEFFYSPKKYRHRFWNFSRLMSLTMDRIFGSTDEDGIAKSDLFDPNAEPVVVSLKIIEEFRKDVEATGSQYFVIHLPRKQDIKKKMSGEKLPYEVVLKEIQKNYFVLDPLPAFLNHVQSQLLDDLFVAGKRHYSSRGNGIVAHLVAKQLNLRAKNR